MSDSSGWPIAEVHWREFAKELDKLDPEKHFELICLGRKMLRIAVPELLIVKEAKCKPTHMAFTGYPCKECHSLRTVQTGTCRTCLDCLFSGECG